LKEANNQQWPRTLTERLLTDMFDCPAAQFLAVEEALLDSNRRLAVAVPAGGESDREQLESQEVVVELFLAAEYIACGGAGKRVANEYKNVIVSKTSQISLAANGM
jgi:hypothetical protein